MPTVVSEYSTRWGDSHTTVRLISPSDSSSLRVIESMRDDPSPVNRLSSLKRIRPWEDSIHRTRILCLPPRSLIVVANGVSPSGIGSMRPHRGRGS